MGVAILLVALAAPEVPTPKPPPVLLDDLRVLPGREEAREMWVWYRERRVEWEDYAAHCVTGQARRQCLRVAAAYGYYERVWDALDWA